MRAVLLYATARVELAAPDPALRLKAAQALGGSSDAAVKNMLAALLEKRGEGAAATWVEPSAEVRAAAQASIRAIDRRMLSRRPPARCSPPVGSAPSCCSPRSAWRSPTA